ncbi:MAG TPA: phosphohydrolase [Ruminococcus sp.]|nr:phosphohydrolase [Ruminococcus sp.]
MEGSSTKPRHDRNLITVFLCMAGIAVNLLLSALAAKLELPLYLDTVGSITVAVLGGSLPGVIVGFATNVFKSISDSSALYYGVLNVLIALFAANFSRRGWFRKPLKCIAAIIVFACIGGGLGSLLPMFLDDLPYDSSELGDQISRAAHVGRQAAYMMSSIITDLLDKALSMVLVGLLVKFLPDKLEKFFSFTGWMQTPLSKEESAAAKKTSFRVMSLRTKILLVLSIALVAVSVAATGISMLLYRRSITTDSIKLAESAANIAAGAIDPDRVDEFIQQGEAAPGYNEIKERLYQIRESTADIKYLYVYKILPDGCHVVFDLDSEDVPGSKPGEVIPFDKSFKKEVPILLEGGEIEPKISNGSFGWLLTVYAPVWNSAGECVCYAAADISMGDINVIERNFFIEMLSLFLGFFILIFVIVQWLIEYHIILPVNSIAISTGTFAYDSEKARENSIERIHELNICTGDEVENLYHAIAKTSDDSMRYVADVQKKTEELAQMQTALIMVLADIVESRDQNTGAHVRKTARYAEIILSEMKKKGYYAEKLTDTYISDVISSAPLHDVGKIQVPDAILNKPGRLDDEEFAIMKTHTTAGRDIISQAIDLVPNSGYLDEARNLAAYHHEKWDGSGYPNGMAGEEIPLSARVMAVADVFDALVSKRSYKKPFTFEEAMQIIKDGSGKHFDPLIVDAFVGAEEDIRSVEHEFSQLADESGFISKEKIRKKK